MYPKYFVYQSSKIKLCYALKVQLFVSLKPETIALKSANPLRDLPSGRTKLFSTPCCKYG